MPMATPIRAILAAATAVALFGIPEAASAGVAAPDPSLGRSDFRIEPVQYGYGYGYGYRPYGYGYRPYGYYPYRRFYNNHFGPGAAKERHRTRLDYCIKQPSKC